MAPLRIILRLSINFDISDRVKQNVGCPLISARMKRARYYEHTYGSPQASLVYDTQLNTNNHRIHQKQFAVFAPFFPPKFANLSSPDRLGFAYCCELFFSPRAAFHWCRVSTPALLNRNYVDVGCRFIMFNTISLNIFKLYLNFSQKCLLTLLYRIEIECKLFVLTVVRLSNLTTTFEVLNSGFCRKACIDFKQLTLMKSTHKCTFTYIKWFMKAKGLQIKKSERRISFLN